MPDYKFTQADATTELDALANELGQLLNELDALNRAPRSRDNIRRLEEVRAAIRRIEQRCKELTK